MTIDHNKVLDAISVLQAASIVLFTQGSTELSDRCRQMAEKLHESTVIAGVSHRTFHSTGDMQ